MIVPFWSWNLSDTTHVRSHTKFQLVWAINTAFTRGGLNQPPPLTQMCSWDPLTIRVNRCLALCLNSVLNVKVLVGAFNQEKALVGAFSVITNLRVDLRFKLYLICFSFRHSSLFRSFCDPPSSVMTLVLS